jgi:hypothetical protein
MSLNNNMELKKINSKLLKDLSPNSLDYYLQSRPSYYDIIKYYWIALFNNKHHKMNYIQLKSRLHRTEQFVDYYTSENFKLVDAGNKGTNDIKIAYYIIHRIEWLLTDYGYMLWSSRAPYEVFLSKYIYYRDNILDDTIPLDHNYIESEIQYNPDSRFKPPLIWSNEYYKPINPRTTPKLVKHSIYLALDLISMLEFIKNDIDRNDDLLFKVIILTINGLIFIGQFIWEQYK